MRKHAYSNLAMGALFFTYMALCFFGIPEKGIEVDNNLLAELHGGLPCTGNDILPLPSNPCYPTPPWTPNTIDCQCNEYGELGKLCNGISGGGSPTLVSHCFSEENVPEPECTFHNEHAGVTDFLKNSSWPCSAQTFAFGHCQGTGPCTVPDDCEVIDAFDDCSGPSYNWAEECGSN
jgi:hypothetical protein